MGFQLGVVKREPAGEKGFKKEDAEVVEAGAWPGRAELEEEGETQALDRLCLALGLLTNIVQVVEETKDLLREIRTSRAFDSYVAPELNLDRNRDTSFM